MKRKIDFVTLSPLLLLTLLPVGAFLNSSFTQTAVHPEVAFIKYFAIPLLGFSLGSILFLGIVRNDWKLSPAVITFTERYSNHIIIFISFAFLACFSILAVLRYTSLHTTVFDLGTYDKKIWRISVASLSAIPYEVSLGHFQPIWIFYGFIYKIIDSPVILQALQVIATVSGVIPLYLIAKRHLQYTSYILLIPMAYLLYPPVGFNATLDFHADHLYIPLILWAFYFAEQGKYIKAIVLVGLSAMVKETLILGASFFGLYMAFDRKKYLSGLIVFLLFSILFFFVVFLLIPNAEKMLYPSYSDNVGFVAGTSFPFVHISVKGLAINISELIGSLLSWKVRKLLFVYFLFTPLLFLPLLSWKPFLPALPLIAIPLLSTTYLHSAVDSQYTAGVIAPAFVALVYSLKRIKEGYGEKYALALAVFVFIMAITFHIAHGASPLSINFWKNGWAEIWHKYNYVSGEHEKVIKRAIYNITEDPHKMVISQGNINHARLAHRYKYWVFPYKWENADYILLDLNRPLLMGDQIDEEAYMRELQKILNSSMFQIEFQEDGVLLFGRITRNMAS